MLEEFTRGSYYGRLVQLFLACKYYGTLIPTVGSPTGTDIGSLQRLIDDLYEKPSMKPGASIAILFSNNHLYRTGENPPGGIPSNIWRNNFNMQKGFGCYASAAEILDPSFRDSSRKLCSHLVGAKAGTLEGGKCDLEDSATYRREDHPKVFRVDPQNRELFVYNPSDITHFAPIVCSSKGKLPVGPLIVALYYDSRIAGARSEISIDDFVLDFGFNPEEFDAYFDDDLASGKNAELKAAFPKKISWVKSAAALATEIISGGDEDGADARATEVPLPGVPVPGPAGIRAKKSSALVAGIEVAPPAGSHWWDAEQAVRQVLEADGWTVVDKTRFGVGYDFLAAKSGTTRYVEVKSSAGRCAPTLTDNEYMEARRLRREYVIAIVENFDPKKSATILWVQDPARLSITARQVRVFSIPRSQWMPKAASSIQ